MASQSIAGHLPPDTNPGSANVTLFPEPLCGEHPIYFRVDRPSVALESAKGH